MIIQGTFDSSYSYHKLKRENAPFVELGLEELLKDETQLVAYLQCWLCKFLLPNKKLSC